MGASHLQKFEVAEKIIHTAALCGADAIKVSMFTPDDMTLDRPGDPRFTITEGPWKGSLYSLYEKIAMPYDWIPKFKKIAEDEGLKFIVGVYHPRTVKIALDMGIANFKVASFEVCYQELLEELKEPGLEVYVSTGSARLDDIQNVRETLDSVTLLKCTSQYPSQLHDMNLMTIPDMREWFDGPVGLSDHTCGSIAPVMAVALGATVIEKHIKVEGGLDASFALEPCKFKMMVQMIRDAEKALGEIKYGGPKTYHREMAEGQFVRVVHHE